VADKLNESDFAYKKWKDVPLFQRVLFLKNVSKLLLKGKEEYARLMALEMGKPFKEGIAEIEKCALCCEYFVTHAESMLQNTICNTGATKSFVTYQPIGIVLAIMPWNFPFWQVIRFAAPNLVAGNVGVLKHAPNVSGCAVALENLFKDAGFPESVFSTLIIDVDQVENVIFNDKVKAVTLTGSKRAGKSVAQLAGKVLKKSVLELGGSDPYIILEDADLITAVNKCVTSRLINSGQSCIAAKRFIVVEKVKDVFIANFLKAMQQINYGNPLDEEVNIGPLARKDLRDKLHDQVQQSVQLGATCLLGGFVPKIEGYFYPPTVLIDVKPGMPAFDDEIFGPVASIISVKDENEAIEMANNTIYGLGAAIFTEDLKKGEIIASTKLNAGLCAVNDFVKSDVRLPFGGIKQSGYGRELTAIGMKEFLNVKSVVIK